MNFPSYFQTYKDYFWQWEENGKVLAIPNDSTIAYSPLIADILKALAPQGIPPFGTLLLAVIATNPQGKNGIKSAMSKLIFSSDTTVDFLNLLADLPQEYKEGEKKILLFQAIFEKCHNISSLSTSREIARKFEKYTNLPTPRPLTQKEVSFDLRPLEILNNKFKSVDDIIRKISNLPPLPEPIELEESETNPDVPADLIDQLIHDSKTFFVGSLVRRIWSGLNIPVHSTLPSQQPLGGISDLTNKGDFDKLLITEFANDDLIFMSRLANNEALYLHREIPPSNNELKRVILLDVSLKNWGTPKTIAFATMLAIAKHPKTDIECEAFVIGNGYQQIEIDSIHGIINGLEILDGSLNASKGLESFFIDFPPNSSMEVFLITEPSTLKQAEMLRAANAYQQSVNYWIYTDAEANIDVYKKQQSSKKHIQHLRLPLAELWAQKTKKHLAPKANLDSPYPILFRSSNNIRKILIADDGEIFQLTGERTLLRHADKSALHEKGWEMLHEKLDFVDQDAEVGVLANGDYVLLMYGQHIKQVYMLNLTTNELKTTPFPYWKGNHGFIFKEDIFYHQNGRGCWSIDLDGKVEEKQRIDHHLFTHRRDVLRERLQENNFRNNTNTLKKIRRVFINQLGHLVINNHELRLNYNDRFRLEQSGFVNENVQAIFRTPYNLKFADGSKVLINRSGLITLISSNQVLPHIYFHGSLDIDLGMATEDVFAGNEYYHKSTQRKITNSNFYEKYIDVFIQTILQHK